MGFALVRAYKTLTKTLFLIDSQWHLAVLSAVICMLLNIRHAKVENRPKTYKRITKGSFSVENQTRIAVAQAAVEE